VMEVGATEVGRRPSPGGSPEVPPSAPERELTVEWPRRGPLGIVRLAERAAERVQASIEHRGRRSQSGVPGHSTYQEVFASAPVAMALLDDGLRIVDVNGELQRMLGRGPEDLCGSSLAVVAAPPHPVRLLLLAQKAAAGEGPVVVDHRYVRPDGTEGSVRTSIRRLDTADPVISLVCTLEDFTNEQLALEEQRRQAELDPLTGLLNRRGGDRRLQAALTRMAEVGPVAVVICDADDFKQINDNHGHAAGDVVISGIAGRLRSALRAGDDVARLGGDEFIVVARVGNRSEAAAIAERCVRLVRQPLRALAAADSGGSPLRVTVSAGVAVADPGTDIDPAALLAAADKALYEAKAMGGDRWVLAGPEQR
jgi:diguanylate cyclase (GGDEF)-like protein/PAS domain S-box-containing protein